VARYTLPLAIVGGVNLATFPMASRVAFCWLSHSSLLTSDASKARRMPGGVDAVVVPLSGTMAHRMPVPAVLPLAEMESMPPGMQSPQLVVGSVMVLWKAGVV
jgi:hypothetical protein